MKIIYFTETVKENRYTLTLTEKEKDYLIKWANDINYEYLPYDIQDFLAQLQTFDEDAIA